MPLWQWHMYQYHNGKDIFNMFCGGFFFVLCFFWKWMGGMRSTCEMNKFDMAHDYVLWHLKLCFIPGKNEHLSINSVATIPAFDVLFHKKRGGVHRYAIRNVSEIMQLCSVFFFMILMGVGHARWGSQQQKNDMLCDPDWTWDRIHFATSIWCFDRWFHTLELVDNECISSEYQFLQMKRKVMKFTLGAHSSHCWQYAFLSIDLDVGGGHKTARK